MGLQPYNLAIDPQTRFGCVICGTEMTIKEFSEKGTVAMYNDPGDCLRPICICGGEACRGTIGIIQSQLRRRFQPQNPSMTVSLSPDKRGVAVTIDTATAFFDAGGFKRMVDQMASEIVPKLNLGSGPSEPRGSVPKVCPVCGGRDLFIMEDGGATVMCNTCGRSGTGKNIAEAMVKLVGQKGAE